MSKSEFKEYKAQKERERRMRLSEDQKFDNRKKDLEAKRLGRSTMTEKEQADSKQKERERKRQIRRMKSKEGTESGTTNQNKETIDESDNAEDADFDIEDVSEENNYESETAEDSSEEIVENSNGSENIKESNDNQYQVQDLDDEEETDCSESEIETQEASYEKTKKGERERKKKMRGKRSKELKEYENIVKKLSMRKLRRLRVYKPESETDIKDDLKIWFNFFSQSETTKMLLQKKENSLYLQCIETQSKMTERKSDHENVLDQCVCDFDVDCKFCKNVLESEKNLQEDYNLTVEEEASELEYYNSFKKKERREKHKEMSRKMKLPIDALPERELSKYEKIREDNIAQREKEWAELEAGWEKDWDKLHGI